MLLSCGEGVVAFKWVVRRGSCMSLLNNCVLLRNWKLKLSMLMSAFSIYFNGYFREKAEGIYLPCKLLCCCADIVLFWGVVVVWSDQASCASSDYCNAAFRRRDNSFEGLMFLYRYVRRMLCM